MVCHLPNDPGMYLHAQRTFQLPELAIVSVKPAFHSMKRPSCLERMNRQSEMQGNFGIFSPALGKPESLVFGLSHINFSRRTPLFYGIIFALPMDWG